MKKEKTTWSVCPRCESILSNRFLKRHEKDHTTDTSSVSTPVTGTSRSSLTRETAGKATSEYGFFRDNVLHAVIMAGKLESEPPLPPTYTDQIAYLSIGTMRIGKIAIGESIVINNMYTFRAWPNDSVPDCFVYINCKSRLQRGHTLLLPNRLCVINSLPEVSRAKSMKLHFKDGLSSLPSTVKLKHLTSFVKQHLCRKIFACGNEAVISYFGKPISLGVLDISSEGGVPLPDVDSVANGMQNLHLSLNSSLLDDSSPTPAAGDQHMASTPVSSRAKPAVTPSSATPKSASPVRLEHGLTATSHRFFQVSDATNVTLVDHTEELVPEDDTGGDKCSKKKRVPVLAGADELLSTLSQLIIDPITKSETYSVIGMEELRGCLLYGTSGCGKTLIANTMGRKLKGVTEFIALDATQFWGKQFGDTENRLHTVFQQALDSSPSVVFIDDIDMLCPKKEGSQSDSEKKVLSTLIAEIDRVIQSEDHYVFILAATSKRDAVDMVLRRPGRIAREIEVPIPSFAQRQQIISSLLCSMRHNLSSQKLVDVAADCHGYTGADLQELCREAGRNAVKESRTEINFQDFTKALSTVQPSAMREMYVDVPKVKWTDIGGQEDVKQSLKEAIIWPLQHADNCRRLCITQPRGVLMYGPPGCSKTMVAKALATEMTLNFISIKGPELFNKWVGESERSVRELFRKARNAAPSIIFFDEIDAISVERKSQKSGGSGVGDRVLAQLLIELDGVEGNKAVTVVAATNRPDMIDKALLRPGRLNRLLYVPLPDASAREKIFKIRLESAPLADDVSYKELVESTDMYSGAEIVNVCNEAALIAMKEDFDIEFIQMRHFLGALSRVKPQTTQAMVRHYENYASQHSEF